MAKPKIAFFGVKYFPSKGGTSRVVENLLPELKEEFDITIYCYKHPQAAQYVSGVKTVQFPEIRIKGIGVFIYYFICCCHLLLRGNFDLIHAHKTDSAFFLPILRLKYKLISTSHALPYLNDKWSWIGKTYFLFVERVFMRADSTRTAVSKIQMEYYMEQYKRPVRYIPNGIHPVKDVQPELATTLIAQKNIQPDYVFFAARRIIPLKGCHHLIEALKSINYKGSLVIAGDIEQIPEYTEELTSMAKGLDVHFLGYVSDMPTLNALIQQASLFIFPSEIEGMSMMLLEVGSVGTPMICSDIPPNKAVLSEAEVLFFQNKNSEHLASKLQWAISHPRQMSELARQAKQTIEQEYSVQQVARKYMNLYQEILNKQPYREIKSNGQLL